MEIGFIGVVDEWAKLISETCEGKEVSDQLLEQYEK